MSSDLVVSLREILKNHTNRELIILLNDKGALSSDVLMASLNMTPRMMAYELKSVG